MKLEMLTMPVISTAHLTPATARTLTELGYKNTWTVCATYLEGFFIFVPRDWPNRGLPPDLRDLFAWACALTPDTWWVRLDNDAATVSDLPIYDW